MFVASPDCVAEDEGVLMSLVLDERSQRSFLLLLEAKSMKEMGRVHLPAQIPRGLHGAFFSSKS